MPAKIVAEQALQNTAMQKTRSKSLSSAKTAAHSNQKTKKMMCRGTQKDTQRLGYSYQNLRIPHSFICILGALISQDSIHRPQDIVRTPHERRLAGVRNASHYLAFLVNLADVVTETRSG